MNPAAPPARLSHDHIPGPCAPYLTWPVSRREFYRVTWVALLPTLAWGVIIFGIRPLSMFVSCVVATTFSYILLKRLLPWKKGRTIIYPHCLLSAMLLVALAHPLWPAWPLAIMALLLPLFLAILGGPGRERVHVAPVLVLLVQFAIIPQLALLHTYAGGQGGDDAILARDRLFVGDIREQGHNPASAWPSSRELAGDDAARIASPARVAIETLDLLSTQVPSQTIPLSNTFSTSSISAIRKILDRAFAYELPGADMLALGAVPGRIATVSLIGITIAGLYLSYRYILRPRSACLFLVTFIVATFAFAFAPQTIARAGPLRLWNLITQFPGEIITLINNLCLNSDAPFAAVFILALPGTEPLTTRGRRVFLILAAFFAAALHRLDPVTPTATLALCARMPLAPIFDRFLAKRSWLSSATINLR